MKDFRGKEKRWQGWAEEKLNSKVVIPEVPVALWGALELGWSFKLSPVEARGWTFVYPNQLVTPSGGITSGETVSSRWLRTFPVSHQRQGWV